LGGGVRGAGPVVSVIIEKKSGYVGVNSAQNGWRSREVQYK
jgi:hypothetical protein